MITVNVYAPKAATDELAGTVAVSVVELTKVRSARDAAPSSARRLPGEPVLRKKSPSKSNARSVLVVTVTAGVIAMTKGIGLVAV